MKRRVCALHNTRLGFAIPCIVPSDCAKLVIVLRERYEGKIGGRLAATNMP